VRALIETENRSEWVGHLADAKTRSEFQWASVWCAAGSKQSRLPGV
jgi:hypothetical protein